MSDLEQVTDPSVDVVLDPSSGISLEEQQEILAGINAMSGGSRFVPEAAVTNAKKNGFLFPMFVNIAAIIFMGLGFVLLFLFHGQEEQSIRESSASLGLTERKMIQEIRQETNRLISEKEKEIRNILSKLSAADAEQRELQNSVESLTEEQRERVAALLLIQEEYRDTLAGLQEEKAMIIEDSMQKEAQLRSLAEEKAALLSLEVEQGQASLEAAMEELRQLGREQDRAGRMDDQMNGFYRNLNSQIESGSLSEASATLVSMKEFLNAPSFQGASMEARKQTYLAAIRAMEEVLTETRTLKAEAGVVIVQAPETVQPDQDLEEALTAMETRYNSLNARYTVLEQRSSDQEKALASLSAQGSDQSRVIAEYVTEIGSLRTANVNQQETLSRRDSEIVSLRTENSSRDQQISALNSNVAALRGQLQTANNSIAEGENALAQQRREYNALSSQRDDLQRRHDDLQSQYGDLQSQHGDLQSRYGNLQSQYGNLQSQYGSLQSQHGDLQSRYGNLQSQHGDLQNQYNDLQRRMDAAVRAFTGE